MLLETRLEALEDLVGIVGAGLENVDLLKAAAQGLILVENAAILLERRRADTAQFARGQQRLEQVAGVHHPPGSRAGADNRVNFVDEQHRAVATLEFRQQAFETLLEIAAIFGAGQQRAQVQRVHHGLLQHTRHRLVFDELGQALGNRCFAHPALADQQRVVLAPARQDLNNALDLRSAADQGIDTPGTRFLIEIGGEGVQRILGVFFAGGFRWRGFALFAGGALALVDLGDAVGDEVDHVQAGYALRLEEVDGLGFLLRENRHQHIGAAHLALAGTLNVENGALQDALKAESRLRFAALPAFGDQRGGRVDKLDQIAAQGAELGAAGLEHPDRVVVVQQSDQQVLDGHELVAPRAGRAKGVIQRLFQFLAQHALSPSLYPSTSRLEPRPLRFIRIRRGQAGRRCRSLFP